MNAVRDFAEKIDAFRFKKIVIFGSRVRCDHLRQSDLDVIFVSDDFGGIAFPDRASIIAQWDHLWPFEYAIEPICYTSEEFEKKSRQIGLVRSALDEGIVIELHRGIGSEIKQI